MIHGSNNRFVTIVATPCRRVSSRATHSDSLFVEIFEIQLINGGANGRVVSADRTQERHQPIQFLFKPSGIHSGGPLFPHHWRWDALFVQSMTSAKNQHDVYNFT
jgi:hypothetical protein